MGHTDGVGAERRDNGRPADRGTVVLDEQKDPRVRVIDGTATGRAVLDKVLSRAVEKDGTKLSTLVQDRTLNPEAEVVEELVGRGVVDVVPARLLGLVAEKRPTLDPLPEREVRERLRTVLGGGRPSATDATLLAILQRLGVAKKVLAEESDGMSAKDLKRRVEEASSSTLDRLASTWRQHRSTQRPEARPRYVSVVDPPTGRSRAGLSVSGSHRRSQEDTGHGPAQWGRTREEETPEPPHAAPNPVGRG